MTLDRVGGVQAIDVKVNIPELAGGNAFWIRGYATHRTFTELYRDCINHPDVLRSGKSLEQVRASRHFWCGDRMMPRDKPLQVALGSGADANNQVSLVLRRDYYQIGPLRYRSGESEHVYVDAEAPIAEVIARVLSKEERPGCFDLCDYRNRRLARNKALTDHELWPAQEDSDQPFPNHARLTLRPHVSWLSYVLLIGALVLGALLGYGLLFLLLKK